MKVEAELFAFNKGTVGIGVITALVLGYKENQSFGSKNQLDEMVFPVVATWAFSQTPRETPCDDGECHGEALDAIADDR